MIKILNLFAGIGGNRKLWHDVEVTSVENNKEIAGIYKELFPQDNLVITDAHRYLLEHYNEFDFIWSSPPCQTHSRSRWASVKTGRYKHVYPDMRLYQEIIFLKYNFKGKWVVENVAGYYEPLIPGKKINRHVFWSNFMIPMPKIPFEKIDSMSYNAEHYGFSVAHLKLKTRKDQILKNVVNPKLGKHILNSAFKSRQHTIVSFNNR